ncbi:hypothetical protein N8878_04440 [Psychromonas sp.]|nr:hypothetical protein [Psychromonas sp.]
MYLKNIDGELLSVKETDEYRWFEYGGTSAQSLMNKQNPEEIMIPIYQSLFLFLLIHNNPKHILNLGLGGASIERALAANPSLLVTSVDASQSIIDMAEAYFELPKNSHVVCQQAELFIQHTQSQYDVVLCDLFVGEKSPDFLFTEAFYSQLKQITTKQSLVMINMQADTNDQLLVALLAIKKYFPYIALLEFDDYINIVIVCSSHVIPKQATLQRRLSLLASPPCDGLTEVIERIQYIPNA